MASKDIWHRVGCDSIKDPAVARVAPGDFAAELGPGPPKPGDEYETEKRWDKKGRAASKQRLPRSIMAYGPDSNRLTLNHQCVAVMNTKLRVLTVFVVLTENLSP